MATLSTIGPGLLLAAPNLGDPNFEETVVLIGLHDDDDGSLGWIVNGPALATAETIVRATELVTASETLPAGFQHEARRGGPVAPESIWILYDRRDGTEALPGSILIGDDIAVTATVDALRLLLAGKGPKTFYLLAGYAGWGAGQLANEISRGSWLPAPAKAPLMFDGKLETLWRRAYEDTIGTGPAAFVSTNRGKA